MARREFTRDVRAEIVKRATKNSKVHCEQCGIVAKTWHVDHTDPDGMQTDKKRKLTAKEGKVLCAGPSSCHAEKTKTDVAAIAKAKRVEAGNLRISKGPGRKIQSAGFAKSEKAVAKAIAGKKPSLPPRMMRGFVSATSKD